MVSGGSAGQVSLCLPTHPVVIPPTAKVEQVKFDATTLHAKPELAAQNKMVDDGSGEVEVRSTPAQSVFCGH